MIVHKISITTNTKLENKILVENLKISITTNTKLENEILVEILRLLLSKEI